MVQSLQQRCVFLTHVGEPGGAEYKMRTLCRGVEDAEVITMARGSLQQLLSADGIPVKVVDAPEALQQFRREHGPLSALKSIPTLALMLHRLAFALRHYDVLIPMSQKAFVLTALLKPYLRKPIFWYMNDLVSAEHFNRRTIPVMTHLARWAADCVIVNSKTSQEQWLRAGGDRDRTEVSYSGIDIEAFDAAGGSRDDISKIRQEFGAEGRPLIGIVGRLSEWKGQDVFLDAMAQVPGVAGVIVGGALFGECNYETFIKERIHLNELNDRVTLAGHRSDVPAILAACDVVVHCSVAPEPFGRVIVEAMLAGTPVIATDAGGPREIITHGKTGYLTPAGDADALGAMIKHVLSHPAETAVVATQAQLSCRRRFSGNAMVSHLLTLLKNSV